MNKLAILTVATLVVSTLFLGIYAFETTSDQNNEELSFISGVQTVNLLGGDPDNPCYHEPDEPDPC